MKLKASRKRQSAVADRHFGNKVEEKRGTREKKSDETYEVVKKIKPSRSLMHSVIAIYRDVLNDYKEMIDVEGIKFYRQMIAAESTKKYLVNSVVKELNLSAAREQPTFTALKSSANCILQKCPITCLEYVRPTPRMQYWTLTEFNTMCDDERTLSHIPFLGDYEEDVGFVEDLMTTFEEGIHGTKTGCREFINDYILYHLLKSVLRKHRATDRDLIYQAVHDLFPNKASAENLPSLFADLRRKFGPDDDISELGLPTEEAMEEIRSAHSLPLMMCSRCFTYDCLLHGVDDFGAEPHHRRYIPYTDPCGPNCFKLCMKEMEEIRYCRSSSSGSKKVDLLLNIKTDNEAWNDAQETTFCVLRRALKNDFCKIASMMNATVIGSPPKTCRELYAYSFRTAPISPKADMSPNASKKKRNSRDQYRTFRAVKWSKTDGKVGNTHVYEPCSHPGACSVDNDCSCVRVDNLCTKFCRCTDLCRYRFPGCRCNPGLCRTKQCPCFYANWECDPDKCKSCKCDFLDDPGAVICKNIAMQRGLQKKLVIAPSQVAGWGCFAAESIEKNDFISEYCGEVISHDESERRGKIYDKLKSSYLFGLNDEMVVDATRKGNVIRFANHSKDPNCMAKVKFVWKERPKPV